jgi:beta-glucosidase
LFAGSDGHAAYDFTGRLSFDWPASDCLPERGGIQFHRGYGLSLTRTAPLGRLPESAPVMACSAESR